MASNLRNAPIATWQAGDGVQGYALVRRREVRQDKNGRDYLDLELADASGSVTAKAWSDSAALASGFAVHQFVKFRGQVQSYRDQLQLKLDQCRAVVEADRADGFDESRLVPTTREDIDDLWRRLEELLGREIERPAMRRLVSETLAAYGERLKVHPAAKAIHHAFRGGLLEHVVSMLELASGVARHYRELDRDLLLAGVLFHDLGKLRELGAMPANDYTPEGRLVGHIVIGRDLLRERAAAIPDFPADLLLHLEHLVLSHQGKKEFSSPVEPMTAEAIALHAIDDLDSKLAVVRALKETGSGFLWARSLERFIFFGEESETELPAGIAAEVEAEENEGAPAIPPALPDQKRIW